MMSPMVCFITWNRLGLTERNLSALLKTTDDFELYIIDNNSQDDTWAFIETLDDRRIKCKKRFDLNRGVSYAINYALSKRKQGQYFILVENDVYITTNDWVSQFLNVLKFFPNLGMLSATRKDIIESWKPSLKYHEEEDIAYYPHQNTTVACHCMRPELLDIIGYWNEETYGFDVDTRTRINNYTRFDIGFIPTFYINQLQNISCNECGYRDRCTVTKMRKSCYGIFKSKYLHRSLELHKMTHRKMSLYFHEILSGKRTIYCASIHDKNSLRNHHYNHEWAQENFNYFIENAN